MLQTVWRTIDPMITPRSPRAPSPSRPAAYLGLAVSALLVITSAFLPWLEWQHIELPTHIFGDTREVTTLIKLLPTGMAGTKDIDAAPVPQGTAALTLGWIARFTILVICLTNIWLLVRSGARILLVLDLIPLLTLLVCSGIYRWQLDDALVYQGSGPIISRLFWTGPAFLITGTGIEVLALASLHKIST
jgi:hypothetical protein